MQDSVKLLPDYLVTNRNILESEDLLILVQKLAIAIFIGLLIGLEREFSKPEEQKIFAGIRTYPLISIFGFCTALITSFTSEWVYALLLLGFTVLVTSSYIFSAKQGRFGGTSEISMIIVFMLGSLVYWNFIILAAVIGVIVNLFLTLKIQFHSFVGKISAEDLHATLKLAIITVIVLPLLPDATYGPFDVLNPRMIWMMVIFISGISFIGYIIIKFYGKDKGISITGLMGGMVSSTAVAVALSKKSKEHSELSGNFAVGIILASTVMYGRVLFVAFVLNPSIVSTLWIPMLSFTVAGLVISYFLNRKVKKESTEEGINFRNPFELKSALLFGLIFGVIIFVSKAAEVYLGEGGIYAASALAGITSVDAIVISLAKLAGGGLSLKAAAAAVILATISNNIVKAAIGFIFGAIEIRKYIVTGLGILTLVSVLYLLFIFFL